MRVCHACGFVFNAEFDAGLLEYGNQYDNTQDRSAVFDRYLDDLVRHLVEERGARNAHVVEVGCGKGSFLRRLVTYPGANNRGVGYDPTYLGLDSDLGGRLAFRREFYGPAAADEPADVVVCRHVIEHVPQPVDLLRMVRQGLQKSRSPLVFFETPCVDWILRNGVLWDFFYEHCSLFTDHSLATAFANAGFHVQSVQHAFGGQYLWLVATLRPEPSPVAMDPAGVPGRAAAYGKAVQGSLDAWRANIRRLAAEGRLALWGAGAKGCTLANLADPDCTLIDCVVDINPAKQGHFVPGTGHPIVDYTQIGARGVANVILMNPNYRDENLALLAQAGIKANLIEI
jgi:SAM-dependent methyltransferase